MSDLHPARNIPQPLRLFLTLLLIIVVIETGIMFLLPLVMPDNGGILVNFADSFFLAIFSAPFIWLLIARPLRRTALNEMGRTRAALDHIVDAVISFDGQGKITAFNPAATRMFDYLPNEIIGSSITGIIPELVFGEGVARAGNAATEPQQVPLETVGCRRGGSCFPVKISVSSLDLEGERLSVTIVHDISERKRYEEQLEYQTNYDTLTKLPNRNLLADRIRQAMLLSRRNRQQVAIIYVDLDRFKLVNESLGFGIGDTLLQTVADRLAACVREGDTVARHGADEFVVVIPGLVEADVASHIAATVRKTVARPIRVDEHELVVTCSVGISLFPRDGEDVQTLVKNAEVAMHRAKEQGRNTLQFYTSEINARSLARMTMEKHLWRALENGELLLYYQPKVSLQTGRITGMEALIRWNSPEMGMVSPVSFIPLAEETGLIESIGEWVIRTACAQNKGWQDAGLPPLTVAVNLSARQFRQTNIAGIVSRILKETGQDPRYLEIELTESIVMQDADRAAGILDELKRMGTCLTMDDFGTGYSSLSYLKRFPFDKLKVDQSFVRDITSDPDSAVIARAVIAMAHSLHLKVIAEGVETGGQLNYLRGHDCDEIQGYYFSRPVPAEEFEQLLRQGRQLDIVAEGCSPERTLLVVDDEKDVIASLQRMMHLEDFNVLAASSAAEGFELLANNRVAVVLSDLWMPRMNGNEFLGRVKELYPETVRILMSGQADLASVTDAVNRGTIYKFLSKPWNDDFIRETISEACRYHRSSGRMAKDQPRAELATGQ